MSEETAAGAVEQTDGDYSDIYAALAKAQAKFPVIKKNRTAKVKSKRTGETFEYQYCTLDAILDAVRPPLAANGISLRHEISYAEGIWVEAIITHRSGVEIRSGRLPVPNCDQDMQALGSGLTYARRYTANAVLGICPEEDDDAQLTGPSSNPYRDEQNRRGNQRQQQAASTGAGAQQQPRKPSKEDVLKAIGSIGSAAGLAQYLTERLGETPVSKSPKAWTEFGVAVRKRLDASTWSPEQKAVVAAVLTAIRNELAEGGRPAAAPAQEQPQQQAPAAPQLDDLCRWCDGQLTPGDLSTLVDDWLDDSAKSTAIRADKKLWFDALAYALEMTHQRVEVNDWQMTDVEAVGSRLIELKDQAERELNSGAN